MNLFWWLVLCVMIAGLTTYALFSETFKSDTTISSETTVMGIVSEQKYTYLLGVLAGMGLTLEGDGPHKTIYKQPIESDTPARVVGTLIEDHLHNMDMKVYVVILRPAYIAVLKPFGVFIDGRKDYGPHDRKE